MVFMGLIHVFFDDAPPLEGAQQSLLRWLPEYVVSELGMDTLRSEYRWTVVTRMLAGYCMGHHVSLCWGSPYQEELPSP